MNEIKVPANRLKNQVGNQRRKGGRGWGWGVLFCGTMRLDINLKTYTHFALKT